MPDILENFVPLYSDPDRKNKKERVDAKNEKVSELYDHVDYAERMEEMQKHILDIEKGLYKEEYEIIDAELRISFTGDYKSSLISIRKDSPATKLVQELINLGYSGKEGTKNIALTKFFENR